MKKFAWVLGTILLALTVLAVSCAKPAATTPVPPAAPPKVTVSEAHLADASVEKSTVTIHTPEGLRTLPITSNTALTFEGKACTLEQLDELTASGEFFDCTVVYDEEGNVAALNVYRLPQPASVRGSISDVNLKESTITVKTAEGTKEYHVDQTTGLLIGGDVISLELLNALLEAGIEVPSATIISTTDAEGHAVYVDIASLPNLTQATGTVKSVDVVKSTVTITTDKGDRTFVVDAKTGQFLNGEVCSLDDVLAALEHGQDQPQCQVLFFTDKAGKLVYIDVAHTINP